jgi:hypothetical protein
MKKSYYHKFHFFKLAQYPSTINTIKFTATITNEISDTLVIRGANTFQQVIPINANNSLMYLKLKRFLQFIKR